MLAAVTSAIADVLGWIGSVITALTGQSGALAELLPLFAVGIAISAILLGNLIALFPQIRWNSHVDNTEPSPLWEGVETRRGNGFCRRYSPIYMATCS